MIRYSSTRVQHCVVGLRAPFLGKKLLTKCAAAGVDPDRPVEFNARCGDGQNHPLVKNAVAIACGALGKVTRATISLFF